MAEFLANPRASPREEPGLQSVLEGGAEGHASGNRKPAGDLARQIQNRFRAVSQVPGLRELRLAESEQILPPAGNRKPASDRAHWIQRPRADNYTENFASSRFQGFREMTSREEAERPPENRLGRSQHAPACPRNRKTSSSFG